MKKQETLEVPVKGMDCAECTMHVQNAIAELPGVESVNVYLTSEKAIVRMDPQQVNLEVIRKAVAGAGYAVPQDEPEEDDSHGFANFKDFSRSVLLLFGLVFGAVLFIVVVGEWLGLFEAITERVPWPIGLLIVLAGGFPVFRNVLRATFKGQIISHTLMTVGVIAALAVGEWATAAVVVFFMRVGDYAESFTAERARRAVKDLTALAPQTARVLRDGEEVELPIGEVEKGEVVVVRPGEKIPVDGEVVEGNATVNQATITGESMPVDVGPGAKVYAATIAQMGSLRVRTSHVGRDTTFGKVITLVEEAEAHRADVQRVADKFSAYYLPVVGGVALLTYILSGNPLSTAAVLVVACSCSFALATPIAMMASVGAGAKQGLMIKGGKYLELLSKADVLLIDKTGTLTLGKPQITEIFALNGDVNASKSNGSAGAEAKRYLLKMAASAERYSEHPLAKAVRAAARQENLELDEPRNFEALPGIGVRAAVNGHQVKVGSRRLVEDLSQETIEQALSEKGRSVSTQQTHAALITRASELEEQGQTVIYIVVDGEPAGLLAAADTLRSEVPQAVQALRDLGLRRIELLTGDNRRTAAALAEPLGVDFRAELLPEDKIQVVKDYQAKGHTVVMVGDGVNDAPALAQADVGIAMGAAGSDVAIEAAHIALMREDWTLVPEVVRIARRTMRVVKMNIAFTGVYNFGGLTLAAFGFLPPIFAAAAQSFPDLGILANSSRLLRQK